MINTYIVAERIYETYCEAVGGVAFNGDKLPSWTDFYNDPNKLKQRDAWMKAAESAMELLS